MLNQFKGKSMQLYQTTSRTLIIKLRVQLNKINFAKRIKDRSATVPKTLIQNIRRLLSNNINKNVTLHDMNRVDIAHTRCLQEDFTSGVVLKVNMRIIKNDTTKLLPQDTY